MAGLAWTRSATGMGFLVGGLRLGVWGGFRRRILTVVVGISLLGVSLAVIRGAPAVRRGTVADALGIQSWYLPTGTFMVLMAGATLLVPTVMGLEQRGVELRREAEADGRGYSK